MRADANPESTAAPATVVGENIAMDPFKLPTTTIGGNNWGWLSIDEVSGYAVVVFTKAKSDVLHALALIIAHYNGQKSPHKIQMITTDHESVLLAARTWLQERGIRLNDTVPYQHQKLVERYKQTIDGVVRVLLSALSYVPPEKLYAELYAAAVDMVNARLCNKSIGKSPMQIFEGRRPMMYEHPWGTVALFYDARAKTRRSELGIIVGFSKDKKDKYTVFFPESGLLRVRSKVVELPNQEVPDQWGWKARITTPDSRRRFERIVNGNLSPTNVVIQTGVPVIPEAREGELTRLDDRNALPGSFDQPPQAVSHSKMIFSQGGPIGPSNGSLMSHGYGDQNALPFNENGADLMKSSFLGGDSSDGGGLGVLDSASVVTERHDSAPVESISFNDHSLVSNTPRKGVQATNESISGVGDVLFDKSDSAKVESPAKRSAPITAPEPGPRREGLRERKPVDYSKLNIRGAFARVNRVSLRAALRAPDSQVAVEAIAAEMRSLYKEHGAFTPVRVTDLPWEMRRQAIRGHCFLKDKFKPDGTFEKKKARFVMGGDQQSEETYDETTSPTVNPLSLMILINIMASTGMQATTGDVPTAFLRSAVGPDDPVMHVEIDASITQIMVDMFPELGEWVTKHGTLFMRLNKFIYGLKQAAYKFNCLMNEFFEGLELVPTKCDQCVYTRVIEGAGGASARIICALHVDDILILSDNVQIADWMRGELLKKLAVVCDPGSPSKLSFIGMTVERDVRSSTARVSMAGYTENIVEKYGNGLSPVGTPATDELFKTDDSETVNPGGFASVLMTLMYLARFTRPDILLAVSALATRMRGPTARDWIKLNRIIRYVKKTKDFGINYAATEGGPTIQFYVDASHAVYPDGKGQGSIIITMGSGPVLAKTWKLKHVVLSSTEAELSALSEAATYVLWTREFMREIGFEQVLPTVIHEDNQAAITMSKAGGGTFKRSKHMVVRAEFVKELIDSGGTDSAVLPDQ